LLKIGQYGISYRPVAELMIDVEADNLIGQTAAGRYEVLACLDAAGTSRVYKVKDSRDSVIKVMKFLQDFNEERLEQFLAEADKVKNRIKHPHLAQLHDVGVVRDDDGKGSYVYLVSEFLSGRSLYSILNRQGRIELQEALPIFIQICDLLRHLHAAGLCDLNLSPRKIMVSGEGESQSARLTDTGLSSMLSTFKLEPGEAGSAFPEGVLYLSPEQCGAQPVDNRSDVYALGCIMYECLVGLPPFLSKSPYEVSRMHINEEAKPLRMSRDDLNFPLELDLLVLKSLRKNPHQRQQDMNELLDDLQHVRHELAKVPDISLAPTGKHGRWFGDLLEDLCDLTGIDSTLKVKLALPIIMGFLIVFGSIALACLLPPNIKMQDPSKAAEREADREFQQLDAQAQKDFERHNLDSAESRYVKALQIAEKFGDDRRRLLSTLQKLQYVYMAQKRYDKSDEIEDRMKSVMAQDVQQP
jgi:serine/threonine protein kinase